MWMGHPKGQLQILGGQAHPTLERVSNDLRIAGLCRPETAYVIHPVARGQPLICHTKRDVLSDEPMHQARVPTRISSSKSTA
jgi:hypothetical protein